jgi:hypothetical protein
LFGLGKFVIEGQEAAEDFFADSGRYHVPALQV